MELSSCIDNPKIKRDGLSVKRKFCTGQNAGYLRQQKIRAKGKIKRRYQAGERLNRKDGSFYRRN
ncbi:MAG: hypothetical protein FT726_07620 [Pantoea sp. Morm]|uniref:hypothetical protein n=1 Tax=Pantoea sp. Morm TaxID=2601250 RepID=UPI001DBE87FE|nr:hypothetical protein [Pantoea sp. Morm]